MTNDIRNISVWRILLYKDPSTSFMPLSAFTRGVRNANMIAPNQRHSVRSLSTADRNQRLSNIMHVSW